MGFNPTFLPGASEPSAAGINGVITITGIPAGHQVLLSNINMRCGFSAPASGLVITNCAGDVLIEDVLFMNAGQIGQDLRIVDCANVVLRGCAFELAGAPFHMTNSSVLLTTTSLYHVPPFPLGVPPLNGAYTQTAEALRLTNSTVTVVASLVWGCDLYGPPPMGARDGVVLNQSTLRVGPDSLVEGGWISGIWHASGYASPQPSLCTVHKDWRANIPVIPPAGPPPQPTDIHVVFHAWVVADEPFDITVAGPPDGFALLLLGDMTPFPSATPWGALAVDPLSTMLVDLVGLPQPEGYFEWTFHCPSAAPNAHAFAFQALTLSPNGELGLTVPTPFTVGWEHGRIP